jgi:NAD(P)-dependent dehydrogenase (short-subunit alcohol dehydrogenase family)
VAGGGVIAATARLANRVALVTGGGRGLGAATCRVLAGEGAIAVAADVRLDLAEQTAGAIRAAGGKAAAIELDVTDAPRVDEAVRELIAGYGAVDVLVNNAGAAGSAPFAAMDDALWDRLLAVNLHGTYFCMRAMLPSMFGRGRGRVINVASIAGKTGFPYTSAYCAAKHAVVGLTRAVALEAAGKGVTVNAICPGWLDTDMTRESIARICEKTGRTPEAARAALEQMNPQRRLIAPEEVAALAAFLASPEAGGINGQALNIDGGELVA